MNDPYNVRKQGERRQEVIVVDKTTEHGVKIQNILTALVLGVMSWVGWNINTMKDDISGIREIARINERELQHLNRLLQSHISDRGAHHHESKQH